MSGIQTQKYVISKRKLNFESMTYTKSENVVVTINTICSFMKKSLKIQCTYLHITINFTFKKSVFFKMSHKHVALLTILASYFDIRICFYKRDCYVRNTNTKICNFKKKIEF
jgi:hypothetical protein